MAFCAGGCDFGCGCVCGSGGGGGMLGKGEVNYVGVLQKEDTCRIPQQY